MLWFDIAGSFNHVRDMICRHVYSILGAILIVRWTFSSKANLISATYSFFLAESRFVLSWGFEVAWSKINWLQKYLFANILIVWRVIYSVILATSRLWWENSIVLYWSVAFILKQTKVKRVRLFTSLAVWSCHITALENQIAYRLSSLFPFLLYL